MIVAGLLGALCHKLLHIFRKAVPHVQIAEQRSRAVAMIAADDIRSNLVEIRSIHIRHSGRTHTVNHALLKRCVNIAPGKDYRHGAECFVNIRLQRGINGTAAQSFEPFQRIKLFY